MTFLLADRSITIVLHANLEAFDIDARSFVDYTPYWNCKASLDWMSLLVELKTTYLTEGVISQKLHDSYIQRFQDLKPAIFDAHKNSNVVGHLNNPAEIEEHAARLTEQDWVEACNAVFVAATIPPEHIHNKSTKKWSELEDEVWAFFENPASQMTNSIADNYRQQFEALKPAILDAEKKTCYADLAEEWVEDMTADVFRLIDSAMKKPLDGANCSIIEV